MDSYYIKLQDAYLQVDDRDNTLFSKDKVGTLYTTVNEDVAQRLLSIFFPSIPYYMFTLELVTPLPTKYHRYARVGTQYLVWCVDGGWHNERDLPRIGVKPVEYNTPGRAVQVGSITVKPYAHTVL